MRKLMRNARCKMLKGGGKGSDAQHVTSIMVDICSDDQELQIEMGVLFEQMK